MPILWIWESHTSQVGAFFETITFLMVVKWPAVWAATAYRADPDLPVATAVSLVVYAL